MVTNRNLSMKIDPYIDLIRGIAIIMVFLVHFGQRFGNPLLMQFGQMGCQMFIFISGYTCSFSLHRSKSKFDFYRKRFLSIVFEFYTVLIFIVIANIICHFVFNRSFIGIGNTGIISVLCNVFLVHGVMPFCNNSVFPGGWFIGTIFILYYLHPFIDRLFQITRKHFFVTITVFLVGVVLTALINKYLYGTYVIKNNSFVYFLFINQLSCYTLGINLYYYENSLRYLNKINLNRRFIAVTSCNIIHKPNVAKCASFMAFSSLVVTVITFYGAKDFSFLIVSFLMGLVTCFLYLGFKSLKINTNTKFNNVICSIGKYSLLVYLTHSIVVGPIVGALKKVLSFVGITDLVYMGVFLIVPCIIITGLLSVLLMKIANAEKQFLLNEPIK